MYIKNVGYSNVKQMYRLQNGENSIVQLESVSLAQERFSQNSKSDRPRELLKNRMESEGWFVLYTVESDVANLAD